MEKKDQSLENPLYYLDQGDQEIIEELCESIFPFLEKYPSLNQVDLVIEGGFGNGETIPHITKRLFPNALYIGMDLSRGISSQYFEGEKTLEQIQKANQKPTVAMSGAKIRANCFDTELIQKISVATEKKHPLLCSWLALNALLDKKMNPWDKKKKEGLTSIDDMVNKKNPYQAQLHMGVDWEDEQYDRYYFQLEEQANQSEWATERLTNGLLLIRSEQ